MPSCFELRALRDEKSKPRLFLVQLPGKTESLPPVELISTAAWLDTTAVRLVGAAVAPVVNMTPESYAQLVESQGVHPVEETDAIRLGLLAVLVKGLRSEERAQKVAAGLAALSPEESATWLTRITRKDDPKDGGIRPENARASLLILLCGEG